MNRRRSSAAPLQKKRAPAIQPTFDIRIVSQPPHGPRIMEIGNFVSASDAEALVRARTH